MRERKRGSTLRAELHFVFLRGEEKRTLCLNPVNPLRSSKPKLLDQSILFSLLKLFFFEREHPFIDKPIVITEPAVPSAQLLGLGSKLYPSNMQRMLNKDLTRFKQSHSRVHQNQACERKALDLLTG